jgi:hypothetical protein
LHFVYVAVLRDEGDERLTTFDKRGVFISHAPFEPLEAPEPSSAASNSSSPSPSPSSSASLSFRYDSGFRDPFVYQHHDDSEGTP